MCRLLSSPSSFPTFNAAAAIVFSSLHNDSFLSRKQSEEGNRLFFIGPITALLLLSSPINDK